MNKLFKLKSFTLAEVLITLGIIGVVSALTIPTLMTKINSAQIKTKFKKEISVLNQAVRLAQADYGVNFGDVDECYEENETLENGIYSLCSIFNSTLKGATFSIDPPAGYKPSGLSERKEYYISPITHEELVLDINYVPDGYAEYPVFYQLPDGAILSFSSEAKNCTRVLGTNLLSSDGSLAIDKHCLGFIDVNGISPPNKEATCSNGRNGVTDDDLCDPANERNGMGDIFPIVFYDGTVDAASGAGKYILKTF